MKLCFFLMTNNVIKSGSHQWVQPWLKPSYLFNHGWEIGLLRVRIWIPLGGGMSRAALPAKWTLCSFVCLPTSSISHPLRLFSKSLSSRVLSLLLVSHPSPRSIFFHINTSLALLSIIRSPLVWRATTSGCLETGSRLLNLTGSACSSGCTAAALWQ